MVVVLFAKCFTDKERMVSGIADKLAVDVSLETYIGLSALYMFVLLATTCLLGELLCFHIILSSKSMSTYDYIIAGQFPRAVRAEGTAD